MKKEEENKLGLIYQILNVIDDKVYVGSTINKASRKNQHYTKLRSNKHYNTYLQNAFNKYGQDYFIFSVLESDVQIDKLTERELHWINAKNSLDRKYGYNLCIPNPETLHKHLEETKIKNGYNTYKRKRPNASMEDYLIYKEKADLKKSKVVKRIEGQTIILKIDKVTGTIINEFSGITEAAKAIDNAPNNHKRIWAVLKGKKPSFKGFIYIYKKDYNPDKQYVVVENQKGLKRRQSILQLDKDGNLLRKWSSVQEVNEVLGYSIDSLYTVLTRKSTLNGFYWSRN